MALAFVFASIPRQMKNFFASGLIFFAIGVYRLQQNLFPRRRRVAGRAVGGGLALMLAAAYYAPLRVAPQKNIPQAAILSPPHRCSLAEEQTRCDFPIYS